MAATFLFGLKTRHFCVAAILGCALSSRADPLDLKPAGGGGVDTLSKQLATLPLGEAVSGGFTPDHPDYFVGQPVYAIFRIKNAGGTVIQFPVGSDNYNGRSARFSFVAVNDKGERMPDPVVFNGWGGGLGSSVTLQPGQSYYERLLVNNWCAFTEPGHYAVTCKRTLNLMGPEGLMERKTDDQRPALPVENKIEFTMRRDDAALAKYVDDIFTDLSGSNPKGRSFEAMRALALVKTGAAFDRIAELARKPGPPKDPLQMFAIDWLSCYGAEKAAPVILQASMTGNPWARTAALNLLVTWKAPAVAALIEGDLVSKDASIREQAVLACSKLWVKDALPILLGMVHDPDPLVRRYLGAALGASGNERAEPALLKLLNDSNPDPFIKIWAAQGLGKLGRKKLAVVALMNLLRNRKPDGSNFNVMAVLEELTGEKLPERVRAWQEWWAREGKAKYSEG